METFNCIIVDDDEMDQMALILSLNKFPRFKILGVFTSPEKALSIVSEIQVDVLFLDIQMPGINGIEFRRRVSEVPVCVFISYSPDFAMESYELETLDYILKPWTLERFSKTVGRIETFMNLKKGQASVLEGQSNADAFYIKDGTEQIRLKQGEIFYLEALRDYTLVYTAKGRYSVISTLGSVLQRPEFNTFIRIHRSYAINKNLVNKINRHEIVMENGALIPISRSYKDNLSKIIT